MISFKGFVSNSLLMLKNVQNGKTMKDKINILCDVLITRVPNFLRNRIVWADSLVKQVRLSLCKSTILVGRSGREYVCSEEIYPFIMQHQEWERCFAIKKGDVFLDVGAYIGLGAIEAAKITGEMGLVIAVESYFENYRALWENIRRNKVNVTPLLMAAWSSNCILSLRQERRGPKSYSVKTGFKLHMKVIALPLDTVLGQLSAIPDWIKIDVVGAEYEVLTGLCHTLMHYHPDVLVCMFPRNIQRIKKLMEDFGYCSVKRLSGTNAYWFRRD